MIPAGLRRQENNTSPKWETLAHEALESGREWKRKFQLADKLNKELLAALEHMVAAYREGVQDDREPMMVLLAITAIAKAKRR